MSSIQEFYRNEQILITGGTGFVGKLLISKLFLSCPEIKNIILLTRNQEDTDVNEKLKILFNDVVFEKLKKEYPLFREKIELIEGNCELPNFGLTHKNKFSITQRVTIVFHCAANVEFNQDLQNEVKTNVVGVAEMVKLAKQIRNLKSLVCVSSAYCNCHFPVVEEKYYPPNVHYKTLIELADKNFLNSYQRQILGNTANTYFYSKSAAEQVIVEEGKNLPIAIFRPSAIISTWKEPVAGWMDKAFAPTIVVKSLALGTYSSLHCPDELIVDMVPADFTINALIAVSYDIHNRFINNSLSEPRIYNYVSMIDNTLTLKTFFNKCFNNIRQKPSNQAVWYPTLATHKYRLINKICSFIRPWLLIAILQTWTKIKGTKKSNLWKNCLMYAVIMDLINHLVKHPHIFVNTNIRELWNDMSDEDKKNFSFDLKELNWDCYLKTYYDGILRFLLNEDNTDIEKARKRMFLLKIVYFVFVTSLYLCGLLLLEMMLYSLYRTIFLK